MSNETSFDFEYEDTNRDQLLAQVEQELKGLTGHLDAQGGLPPSVEAVLTRLRTLPDGEAELSEAPPNIFPLNKNYEGYFNQRGLAIPKDYEALKKQANFFWFEQSVTFHQGIHKPFNQIEFRLEFDPNDVTGANKPKAHSIAPSRKLIDQLKLNGSAKFGITGNLDLGADAELQPISLPINPIASASASGTGDIGTKLGLKLDVMLKFLNLAVKKDIITHSTPGTDKILWTLNGAQEMRELDPIFFVIVQVPKPVTQLVVKETLHASTSPGLSGTVLDVLQNLSDRVRQWLVNGTPIPKDKAPYAIDLTTLG